MWTRGFGVWGWECEGAVRGVVQCILVISVVSACIHCARVRVHVCVFVAELGRMNGDKTRSLFFVCFLG